ncbi:MULTISPECIES: hypothetical protein [Neobacillus]|jgi:hypothetical protein|uniref:Uncharacterized protein n=1 Tax=Neobacillus sedimentimangrovi TaxID=2699460 RepID=A0ABS8QKW6_9BACI|nr:hypothetical protein [Neobacillus sedimentimangrovi]AIM15250.1 hypothetical protein HW35_02235 [Bacillus sp. X1(2014)]MCD4839872.1 hypothetical protein [Neobacillus sedimentimangrovi]
MDKITCIAYLLFSSSKNQDIKEKAIQLLNGDVSIRDLKRNSLTQPHLVIAESILRKKKIDKNLVQQFAEKYMTVEI